MHQIMSCHVMWCEVPHVMWRIMSYHVHYVHVHYVQVHPLWDAGTMLAHGKPLRALFLPAAREHASHASFSLTPPPHTTSNHPGRGGLGYIGGDAYARARAWRAGMGFLAYGWNREEVGVYGRRREELSFFGFSNRYPNIPIIRGSWWTIKLLLGPKVLIHLLPPTTTSILRSLGI